MTSNRDASLKIHAAHSGRVRFETGTPLPFARIVVHIIVDRSTDQKDKTRIQGEWFS